MGEKDYVKPLLEELGTVWCRPVGLGRSARSHTVYCSPGAFRPVEYEAREANNLCVDSQTRWPLVLFFWASRKPCQLFSMLCFTREPRSSMFAGLRPRAVSAHAVSGRAGRVHAVTRP